MCRVTKIHARIWNDEKFATLSDRGKLAFFFLQTHPHLTAVGAMRATLPGLAAELGWKERAFRNALLELSHQGLVRYCEKGLLVWVPNYLTGNRPESPNVVKSWEGLLDLIPECPLRDELLRCVIEFIAGLGEAFAQALPPAFRPRHPLEVPTSGQTSLPDPQPAPSTPSGSRIRENSDSFIAPPKSHAVGDANDPTLAAFEEMCARQCEMDSPVFIPLGLQTPEFLAAWSKWLAHLSTMNQPLSPYGTACQLQVLTNWGPAISIEAINQSIAVGGRVIMRHDPQDVPVPPVLSRGSKMKREGRAGKRNEPCLCAAETGSPEFFGIS